MGASIQPELKAGRDRTLFDIIDGKIAGGNEQKQRNYSPINPTTCLNPKLPISTSQSLPIAIPSDLGRLTTPLPYLVLHF